MLNVAFALNVLFVMLYWCVFKEARWLSPGIFASLVGITYLLLRFTPVRRYIKPTTAVHVIFVCSYAIPVVAFCIAFLAIEAGANAIGSVMLIGFSLVPASILLIVGILILFLGALQSESRTKL